MQIHELTRHRVDEGFLDDIKAAGQTIKKGYQQGGVAGALKAGTSNQAYAQAKQDVAAPEIARQTAGLAQKYAQDWQTQSVNLVSAEKKSANTPPVTTNRPAPGQMPASVVASTQGQKMIQAYGKPRGGIQDIKSDLEETPQEYSTPSGIVVPAGSKTDKSPAPQAQAAAKNPLETTYSKAFQKWASDKLTTKERTTNQTIDVNYLFQHIPSSKRTLDQLTATVYNTRKDPNANTQAVTNYMTTAMKFIQQVASEIRKTAPVSAQQKVIASTGDPAKDQLLKKDGWTVTL